METPEVGAQLQSGVKKTERKKSSREFPGSAEVGAPETQFPGIDVQRLKLLQAVRAVPEKQRTRKVEETPTRKTSRSQTGLQPTRDVLGGAGGKRHQLHRYDPAKAGPRKPAEKNPGYPGDLQDPQGP